MSISERKEMRWARGWNVIWSIEICISLVGSGNRIGSESESMIDSMMEKDTETMAVMRQDGWNM